MLNAKELLINIPNSKYKEEEFIDLHDSIEFRMSININNEIYKHRLVKLEPDFNISEQEKEDARDVFILLLLKHHVKLKLMI